MFLTSELPIQMYGKTEGVSLPPVNGLHGSLVDTAYSGYTRCSKLILNNFGMCSL